MTDNILKYRYEGTGKIAKWCIKKGDKVESGQQIAIIQLEDIPKDGGIDEESNSHQQGQGDERKKKKKKQQDKGERYLIADHDGVVRSLEVGEGDQLSKSQVLGQIEYCTHEMQFRGLCASCGWNLTERRSSLPSSNGGGGASGGNGSRRSPTQHDLQPTHSILHGQPHITVSHKLAQQIEEENAKRLLSNHKLSLVLDLDHTIIHAIMEQHFMEVPYWRTINRQQANIHEIILNGHQRYFIKLRPHLYEFLNKVNDLFELHIYTMGTRNYAQEIANLVDPNQRVFKERILSRDDTPKDMNHKTLKRLFPCDDSMVLIVDDRSDVWKKSKNLIQIVPYLYFVGCKDMVNLLSTDKQSPHQASMNDAPPTNNNNTTTTGDTDTTTTTPTTDTSSIDTTNTITTDTTTITTNDIQPIQPIQKTKSDSSIYNENDENEGDHHLRVILSKLTEIHSEFYKQIKKGQKPHVTNIVDGIKKNILNGVYIVLSGIYPINHSSQPQPLRVLAEELGAVVQNEINRQTTHVMAARKGTSKVHQATSKGLHVVSQQWLEMSALNWRKLDESDFPLKDDSSPPSSNKHQNNNNHQQNNNNNNENQQQQSIVTGSKLEEIVKNHIDTLQQSLEDADRELEEFLAEGSDDENSSNGSQSSNKSDNGDSDNELSNLDDDEHDHGDGDHEDDNSDKSNKRKRSDSRNSNNSNSNNDNSNGSSLNGDDKEDEELNSDDGLTDFQQLLEEELEKSFQEEGL